MRSWMDPSTTTRTGLTLRLTSSPRLCALTQTRPATSWVCSESMFPQQYNQLVPSFLCKRKRNYGHAIITENDVINVKKIHDFQWHSERCGIRTPSVWHQAESFGQRWFHKDSSWCGRSPGQNECHLGAGSGKYKYSPLSHDTVVRGELMLKQFQNPSSLLKGCPLHPAEVIWLQIFVNSLSIPSNSGTLIGSRSQEKWTRIVLWL